MGWACSIRGREEYFLSIYWEGTEMDPPDDSGMNGRNRIDMGVREMSWEDVGCNCMAEDRNKWPAFVDTVMKLRVS